MGSQTFHTSPAFQTFITEAPAQAQAWAAMCQELERANALDPKTGELAYLAVLAALRLEGGIPFHVEAAKKAGASREEVISAILVGLPAAGHAVVQLLPAAVAAFDTEGSKHPGSA
jgi:alkylhydroperoxidase/carboxymuconolactone decarboxylase family protein YurZ